jgi:hypothetical protein
VPPRERELLQPRLSAVSSFWTFSVSVLGPKRKRKLKQQPNNKQHKKTEPTKTKTKTLGLLDQARPHEFGGPY